MRAVSVCRSAFDGLCLCVGQAFERAVSVPVD